MSEPRVTPAEWTEAKGRRILELRESVPPYGMDYRAIAVIIRAEAQEMKWGSCQASLITRWRKNQALKVDELTFNEAFEAIQDVLDQEAEIEKRDKTEAALKDGTDAAAMRNWLNAREHYNKHSSIQRHHHTVGPDPEIRYVVPQSDEFKPPDD